MLLTIFALASLFVAALASSISALQLGHHAPSMFSFSTAG
jgi:hypothetical protein